jgi:D-alanine-D-alanine ligase
MTLRVAVLANLKKNAPHDPALPADAWDDLDSDVTINAIISALHECGHQAEFLEGNLSLIETLPRFKADLCFNICEGHWGDAREAHVPSLLEMMRVPYTGSKVLTLALTLDKPMTKRVLHFHGLPTPAFQVFETVSEPLDVDLKFPLFVKPSREGTGMGVNGDSVVHNEAELRERLAGHLTRYRQPILVERFIRGREVTVGATGNLVSPVAQRVPADESARRVLQGLNFLPPLEVDFGAYPKSENGVYTNRMKTEWAHEFHYMCPAQLASGLVEQLNWLAAAVFRVTGCLDVARVDFRLDADDGDRPYVLEVNPLPGLYPGLSDLVLEAAAAGLSYAELINRIVNAACARCEIAPD